MNVKQLMAAVIIALHVSMPLVAAFVAAVLLATRAREILVVSMSTNVYLVTAGVILSPTARTHLALVHAAGALVDIPALEPLVVSILMNVLLIMEAAEQTLSGLIPWVVVHVLPAQRVSFLRVWFAWTLMNALPVMEVVTA